MIRVLFTGKEHRVRRRETMVYPPAGVEFVPQQQLDSMKPDYKISIGDDGRTKLQRLKDFLRYNNFIPKKDLHNIDLIYSPGKVIFNHFPWVVEVDNVAVLGYYDLRVLNALKPIIKQKLKSKYCKAIICPTATVKTSIANYFKDKTITDKCVVVYPYVKLNPAKRSLSAKTVFLCANTKFYMKGTLTVLKAFTALNTKDAELWVISNTPPEIEKEYSKYKNIKFYKANFTKDQLYEKFYSKADVLVQPTLQDSIGLVYLEAMASGMAIITTDAFAIPEFVHHGKNGFLMPLPFDMYHADRTPKKEYFPIRAKDQEIDLFKPYNTDEQLLKNTQEYMTRMLKDKRVVRSMQAESLRIIKDMFDEEKRKKQLGAVLMGAAS